MRATSTICVAMLTFRRPSSLRRLLSILPQLELPSGSEVRFLVVDNDPEASARATVEEARQQLPGSVLDYVVETEPGIPAARNRALREAIQGGADVLCFVDDDAWPDRRWLVKLVGCYHATDAALVFGPNYFVVPATGVSCWQRLLGRSIGARSKFVARFAAHHGKKGRVVTSGTGNWLGDLRQIQAYRLEFDPRLRENGGSDTAFREELLRKGGKVAWCADAIMYEELPADRLGLAYQFHRSRMQGINAARFRRPVRPVVLRHPLGRLVVGLGLMAVPVLGWASPTLGLHMVGMAVGILQAGRGARSRLYPR